MEIEKLGNDRILFRFHHVVDINRVLDDCPWHFDQSLLVLHAVQPRENPLQLPLNTAAFWVHLYGLPPDYQSLNVTKSIGDYIGRFLKHDDTQDSSSSLAYFRIRVCINVRLPLKCEKIIRIKGSDPVTCTFKYEKLPNFCFICGKLGHIDRYCEVLFQVPTDEIVRHWSDAIRAPHPNQRIMIGSPWLTRRGSKSFMGQPSHEQFGAPPATTGALVPFGQAVVASDSEAMDIQEERKHRREVSHSPATSATPPASASPTKKMHSGRQDPHQLGSGQPHFSGSPTTMIVLSWNCRGLGQPRAVQALGDLVTDHRSDVLFLFETLAYRQRLEEIKCALKFDSCVCGRCKRP
ncbi:hypothetical protein LINGRAHAP2_LOCUS8671 [Linum grandiflorum]